MEAGGAGTAVVLVGAFVSSHLRGLVVSTTAIRFNTGRGGTEAR